MKNIILSFVYIIVFSFTIVAQTTGELSVTASTSEAGGNYAPRNIVAMWIENEQGEFVKTLLAYAQNRRTHLNTWQATTVAAGTEFNTTDAITGATRSNHGTRQCVWNCTDYNGFIVPDGVYYLWMELTDKNSTGNYSSFSFTKNDTPESQTPADVPSFGSILINWEPSGGVSISDVSSNDIKIVPNQSNGVYAISGDNITEVEVRSISGRLIQITKANIIDISNQQTGIYLIMVRTEKSMIIKKVYKQ